MQTGVAVAVIIIIAIILVFLFYLVTRYFNYRLQKSLEEQNQAYSMVEDITVNQVDFRDGEYQEFALSRILQKKKYEDERKRMFLNMAGQEKIKQSFIDNEFDLYCSRKIQTISPNQPIQVLQQSSRTNGSIRNSVQKISDYKYRNQTNFTYENQAQLKSLKTKRKQSLQEYAYISQIVLYLNDQIFILKNSVTSIFRSGVTGQVIQKRYITKKKIKKQDVYFVDTLEAYGFDEKTPGAYKYETLVSLPNMKSQTHYTLKQLKQSESKQQVTFEKFYEILIVLEDI